MSRLIKSLASTTPLYPEAAAAALGTFLSAWLRHGLITKDTLRAVFKNIETFLNVETIGNSTNETASVKEGIQKRCGIMYGFRILLELGFFTSRAAAPVYPQLFNNVYATMAKKCFALIGGDLAADFLARLIVQINGSNVDAEIKAFAQCEPINAIVTDLTNASKEIRTNYQNIATQKQNSDILITLIPKITLILKLETYQASVPQSIAKLCKALRENAKPFIRGAVTVGLAASQKRNVQLAALWPSLFTVLASWQQKVHLKDSSCLNELFLALDANANAASLRVFMYALVWAKTLKCLADAQDKALADLDLSQIYSQAFACKEIMAFWFHALAVPNDNAHDMATAGLQALEQCVRGNGSKPEALWHQYTGTATKNKKRRAPDGVEHMQDCSPFGYLGVVEHSVASSKDVQMRQVYSSVFITPLGESVSQQARQTIVSALSQQLASSKAAHSNKAAQRLVTLFLDSNTTVSIQMSDSATTPVVLKQILASLRIGDRKALVSLSAGLSLGLTSTNTPKQLSHLFTESSRPRGPETFTDKEDVARGLKDLCAKLKLALIQAVKHNDVAGLSLVRETLSMCEETTKDEKLRLTREVNSVDQALLSLLCMPRIIASRLIALEEPSCREQQPVIGALEALAAIDDSANALTELDAVTLDTPVDKSRKWARSLGSLMSLAQTLASLLAENLAPVADNDALESFWNVVMGEHVDDMEGEDEDEDEESDSESEGEEEVEIAEMLSDDGEEPETGRENAKKEEESSGEFHAACETEGDFSDDDEVAVEDLVDVLMAEDDEAELMAEKYAQMQSLKEASKTQGKNKESLSRAHSSRVRALRVLESSLVKQAESLVSADIANKKALDDSVEFMHGLCGRLIALITVIVSTQKGVAKASTAGASKSKVHAKQVDMQWVKRLLRFIRAVLPLMQAFSQRLQAATKLASSDWPAHRDNALVLYAQLYAVIRSAITMGDLGLGVDDLWRTVAEVIDRVSELNDSVCRLSNTTALTPEAATKTLLDESESSSLLWALPLYKNETATDKPIGFGHPTGLHCTKCTPTCAVKSHGAIVIAGVTVEDLIKNKGKRTNAIKLLK